MPLVAMVAIAGVVAAVWLLRRRRPAVDDRAGDREGRWYGMPGYKRAGRRVQIGTRQGTRK